MFIRNRLQGLRVVMPFLVVVATPCVAQHLVSTSESTDSRERDAVCQGRTQPPPCQPFICLDADRK